MVILIYDYYSPREEERRATNERTSARIYPQHVWLDIGSIQHAPNYKQEIVHSAIHPSKSTSFEIELVSLLGLGSVIYSILFYSILSISGYQRIANWLLDGIIYYSNKIYLYVYESKKFWTSIYPLFVCITYIIVIIIILSLYRPCIY